MLAPRCISCRNSVRLSVSATRVVCDKTKQYTADILIPHERAIILYFSDTNSVCERPRFRLKFTLKVTHPFEKLRHRQITAYNVSTVRDSEKVQL